MKTTTLLATIASVGLVSAACPGLVPCMRQAGTENNCNPSDDSCFCSDSFFESGYNCLAEGGCSLDDITTFNLARDSRCNAEPEPTVPTTTAGPSSTEEPVPSNTEGSTSVESTPGSEPPATSTESFPASSPVPTESVPTESASTGSESVPAPSSTLVESVPVPSNGTTTGGPKMTTSTIYATQVRTVTHCPETVTDCPTKPHVTTEIIAISTTVCPVDEPTKKVPAPPAVTTPAHPNKPETPCHECEQKTKTWTEIVKVPGSSAGVPPAGTHPAGNPPASTQPQGSTPTTPVVVTAGAGKTVFSVGGILAAAFFAL